AREARTGSSARGATSGSHLAARAARVLYTTRTPAFLACPNSEAIAGTMVLVHRGWLLQVGSIMSDTSKAVVAGLSVTRTGPGSAGICKVSIDAPLLDGAGWASTAPVWIRRRTPTN